MDASNLKISSLLSQRQYQPTTFFHKNALHTPPQNQNTQKNHKNITSSSLANSETKTKIQRNCQLSGHLHHPIPSSLRPPGFPNDQRTSPLQCWPPSRPRSLHHDQLQCQGDVGALGATNTWPNWKLEHPAQTMQTRSVSLRRRKRKSLRMISLSRDGYIYIYICIW